MQRITCEEIAAALELHRRAYEALIWLSNISFARPHMLTTEMAAVLQRADACVDWVLSYIHDFPARVQPSPSGALVIVHQIGGGALTGTFAQGNSINIGGQFFNIGYGVDATGDGAVTLSPAPPAVQSVVINDGNAQRSMVDSITIDFNEAITFDPSAFELDTVDPNTGISRRCDVERPQSIF